MSIVLKDRVQETTTTTGTSDFTLNGAVLGYQAFSALGNGATTYYAAVDPTTGDWEVGIGTYSTTGPTLTRTTILESSAAGAKISFSAGSKNVFCTYPAEKAIYEEVDGQTLIDGGPLTVVGTGVTSLPLLPAELVKAIGNVNSFAQIYAMNQNDGSGASADFVAYNDLTTDGYTHFIDMGINSSNYSSVDYPIFTAGSGYVFHDGDDFFIGNQTASKDLVLFVGGANTANEAVRLAGADQSATFASDVTVTGNLSGTGGSFTAAVTTTSPSVTSPANNEFVTKAYVDNATSTGLHIHAPVQAETSAALSAVYVQGGTTFNITDITGGNTVVTSTVNGLSVGDQIWLYSTAGNGLSINTPYFVYATPTTTSLQLTTTWNGPLLTGLTNATGLSYATRANSGVGAYLESSVNATLPIAGVSVSDRVLVYQQSTGYWNGVYTVTSLGSAGSKWKLTRASDANYYSPQDTSGLGEGDYFFVQSNSESYVLTTPGLVIIGYTPLTYTLFSSVPVYTGTSPIDVTGTVISLTTVPATLGGTGTSTVTTGDLLYGSGTNTWGKLGVGSAYKALVVNASGTNVEWNAIALNQSGAVSGTLPATNGGTGINAYNVGEMIYANTTTTFDVVTRNTSTTKKFLSQTGTGTAAQAPVWAQPAASDITGLAPSATTDTTDASNITSGTLPTGRLSGSYTGITGVGTLTAGTWNGNTIGAGYGGTGFSSYAVGDLLYADTTSSLAKLADVAVGNALISGGVSSAPSWGKIGLATHVSGTLPIANGGTNATATPTAGAVAYGTGSAYDFTTAGTSGQVLTSAGASTPTWTTATNANTASAIVQRDASGNFSAGTITAALNGNASTATSATSATSATTATNVAGGAANQIVYNTASNTTSFVTAPSVAGTSLTWNGSAFTWASAGGASIANDTTTNATYYPTFATATSGTFSTATVSSTKLTYNPSTGTLAATTFSGALNGTASNTSSISSAVGNSYTWTGVQYMTSTTNTGSSAGDAKLQVYALSNGGAVMSFHRPGLYATNMGLDSDNVFRIGGWSASANRLQMDMSGNLTMAGSVTAYSDETLKTNWRSLPPDFVEQLSKVKNGTYDRIDEPITQDGVSAQSLQPVLPNSVLTMGDGKLSVAYGNAAMVSAVELAKRVVEQDKRIAALEELVAKLTQGGSK